MNKLETLLALVREDMKPAMGVTEPAAIAYATALAAENSGGELCAIEVTVNPGIYNNAFTCGIPHTREVGTEAAAAIGYLLHNSARGLLLFDDMGEDIAREARQLAASGLVRVWVDERVQRLLIRVLLRTDQGETEVTITDSHTHVQSIVRDGAVIFSDDKEKDSLEDGAADSTGIRPFTLSTFIDASQTVPVEDIAFLREAFSVNLALADAAIHSDRYPMTKMLLQRSHGRLLLILRGWWRS